MLKSSIDRQDGKKEIFKEFRIGQICVLLLINYL